MVETSTASGGATPIPEIISRYQDAHDRHDTGVALSAFAPDARVVDDGKEFNGTGEIRTWLTTAASEYTFTRTLVDAERGDDGAWLVVNHLEGDFPGGVIDLCYRFALRNDLIAELVIAP